MPELIDVVPGSPEWRAARRLGVTATDIVIIVGLSAWDSVYGLFWKKLGQVPDEPERDRWELGKALEPYITERWANTGSNWKDYVRWPGGLYRNTSRAWQMATPDRLLAPFNDLHMETSRLLCSCRPVSSAPTPSPTRTRRHTMSLAGQAARSASIST